MSVREKAKMAKSVRSQARSAFDARAVALGVRSLCCAERCAHLLGGSGGGEQARQTNSSLDGALWLKSPKPEDATGLMIKFNGPKRLSILLPWPRTVGGGRAASGCASGTTERDRQGPGKTGAFGPKSVKETLTLLTIC